MYIDVHAHMNDSKIYGDRFKVCENYRKNGVGAVINAGFDIKSSFLAESISSEIEDCYFTAGVHPDDAGNFDDTAVENLYKLAKNKKCVAIGEIGLDYHYEPYDKDVQKRAFIEQMQVAYETELPVVVHTRDSCKDTYDVIKANIDKLKYGFLLHCFSESAETAKEFVKLGAYFSFGGVVTFKNAKKGVVIKNIPVDKILTETDCPYLAPEPLRGSVNEPKNIPLIAKKIAEIYGIEEDVLCKTVISNAENLFKRLKIST